MLFTLQPVGQYESLSDEKEAWSNVQSQLLETETPASIDLPADLNATPAVRLRNQHSPEPSAGLPAAAPPCAPTAFSPPPALRPLPAGSGPTAATAAPQACKPRRQDSSVFPAAAPSSPEDPPVCFT